MIRSLRYASISFGILCYIFLKRVFEVSCIYLKHDSTPTSPAWGRSSRVIIWNLLLRICYSQIAKATTDPDPNSKGQRALIHELLVGLPNFWTWGDLSFFSFYFTFLFLRADLTFRLDLPASTRGQASEASWFPGMWVNSILWYAQCQKNELTTSWRISPNPSKDSVKSVACTHEAQESNNSCT